MSEDKNQKLRFENPERRSSRLMEDRRLSRIMSLSDRRRSSVTRANRLKSADKSENSKHKGKALNFRIKNSFINHYAQKDLWHIFGWPVTGPTQYLKFFNRKKFRALELSIKAYIA